MHALRDLAGRFQRWKAAVVDIGNDRVFIPGSGAAPGGRLDAGILVDQAISDVGGEASRGGRIAAGPLANQVDDELGVERIANGLGKFDTAVGHEDRLPKLNVFTFQPVQERRQEPWNIMMHGLRAQTV